MAKDRVDVLEGEVAVLRWQLDAVMRAVSEDFDSMRRVVRQAETPVLPPEVTQAADFFTRERALIDQRKTRRARRL